MAGALRVRASGTFHRSFEKVRAKFAA